MGNVAGFKVAAHLAGLWTAGSGNLSAVVAGPPSWVQDRTDSHRAVSPSSGASGVPCDSAGEQKRPPAALLAGVADAASFAAGETESAHRCCLRWPRWALAAASLSSGSSGMR